MADDSVVTTYLARFTTQGQDQVDRAFRQTAKAADGFKKSAGDASAGAGKLTRSLGDMSEALDQRLQHAVERNFKAIDRLNSIVGKVGGAIGLATLAIQGAVSIYQALTSETEKTAEKQEALNRIVEDGRQRFEQAKSAVEQFAGALRGARWALDPEVQLEVIRRNQQIADATAQANEALRQFNEADAAARRAQADRARFVDSATREGLLSSQRIQKDLESWDKHIAGAEKAAALAEAQLRTSSAEVKRHLDALNILQAEAVGELSPTTPPRPPAARQVERDRDHGADGALDLSLRFRAQEAARAAEEQARIAALIRDGGAELGGVYRDLGTDLQALTSDVDRFTASLAEQVAAAEATAEAYNRLSTFGSQLGTDFAGAAVDAAIFGESLEQSLNDLGKKTLREAALQSAVELARGFASQGLTFGVPNPGSVSHFTSAGIWAGMAAGGGILAAVTGGVRGGGGGGGGPSLADYGPPTAADVNERDRGGGPIEINLNMNLEGAILTGRDARRAVGRMAMEGIREAEYERGRPRFNASAFRH